MWLYTCRLCLQWVGPPAHIGGDMTYRLSKCAKKKMMKKSVIYLIYTEEMEHFKRPRINTITVQSAHILTNVRVRWYLDSVSVRHAESEPW